MNPPPPPLTDFHPQTDGEVESIIALSEDYLQHYVLLEQKYWSRWLSLDKFSYNNTPTPSTKCSLFFAVHGFHQCLISFVASSGIPAADGFAQHMQDIQDRLIQNLKQAKQSQSSFYNKRLKNRYHLCFW